MKHLFALWFALALAPALAACSGKGPGACTVGSENCECTPGLGCDPGLDCVSGICVNPADTHTDADAPPDTTPADTAADSPDSPDSEAGCSSSADCDDSDPCTVDSCDTDYGTCSHDPVDADLDGYPAASVSGTPCGGTDCDDTRDDVYPGAAESSCYDHIDQACDGARGPMVLTPPVDIALDSTNWMDVAWTGSEFLLATAQYGYDVELTRIGLDGARVTSDVMLGSGRGPAIAWSGSTIGVSYMISPGQIAFRMFDPEGAPLISEQGLPGTVDTFHMGTSSSRIVWTGSEFGIAWRDDTPADPAVRFGRMDADGLHTGIDTSLSPSDWTIYIMDLAWTGSEFLLGRTLDANTYALQRLDAIGNPVGDPLSFAPIAMSSDARFGDRLAWSGSAIGLTECFTLNVFDPLLSPVAASEDLGVPSYPTVSWGGNQFGVAWHFGSTPGWGLYFGFFDESGATLGRGFGYIDTSEAQAMPFTAWTGSEFGLLWSSGLPGGVGFATVGWCD